MLLPTTPPWPQKLMPHKFSCQPKTRKFNPQNLVCVRYTMNCTHKSIVMTRTTLLVLPLHVHYQWQHNTTPLSTERTVTSHMYGNSISHSVVMISQLNIKDWKVLSHSLGVG